MRLGEKWQSSINELCDVQRPTQTVGPEQELKFPVFFVRTDWLVYFGKHARGSANNGLNGLKIIGKAEIGNKTLVLAAGCRQRAPKLEIASSSVACDL